MLQMEVTFDMNAPIFGLVPVYGSCGEAAESLRKIEKRLEWERGGRTVCYAFSGN